jgi:hypothetical protein
MKKQQGVFGVLSIEFPPVCVDIYDLVLQAVNQYDASVGEMETELGVKREAFNTNVNQPGL